MVTANKPTIDSYIYGAVAERAVRDKDPGLAGHIMKSQYFTSKDNPILAQAFVDYYEAASEGDNPLNTSVGRRIRIERAKYSELLEGLTLEGVTKTSLGDGLDSKVKREMLKKDGKMNFGKVRNKLEDYQEDAENKQRKFERKQNEIQNDYQNEMNSAYSDSDRRDISDKYQEKLRKLQKKINEDLKDLENKYKVKDLERGVRSVRALEDARFAVIRRDAVLNDSYFPVKLEDLRKISQN